MADALYSSSVSIYSWGEEKPVIIAQGCTPNAQNIFLVNSRYINLKIFPLQARWTGHRNPLLEEI